MNTYQVDYCYFDEKMEYGTMTVGAENRDKAAEIVKKIVLEEWKEWWQAEWRDDEYKKWDDIEVEIMEIEWLRYR